MIWRRGSLTDNQFRSDREFLWIILETLDALKEDARSRFSHVMQWLANGRKPRIVITGDMDVIESNNGNVLRYTQVRVAQRADGTDRRDIIEGNQSGEFFAGLKELLYCCLAKFG